MAPGHGSKVVGMIKMGNIVPIVEIRPTSLAFQASVLPMLSTQLPRLRGHYKLLQYTTTSTQYPSSLLVSQCHVNPACLLLLYVLATSKVIPGWVVTCDSANF